MEQFIDRLLESSEVIIVMGVVIGALFRMLMSEKKEAKSERTAHKKDIKELIKAHNTAIEKERDYIRQRDSENLETLEAFRVHFFKNK